MMNLLEIGHPRPTDAAWKNDNGHTNYRLKDGDKVKLLYATISDGFVIEAGTIGTVVHARTPRVTEPRDKTKRFNYIPGDFIWFANVDFQIGPGLKRGRVPHNAIKKVRK